MASLWWISAACILVVIHIVKLLEIVCDLKWSARQGRRYQAAVLAGLRTRGFADLDAMDREYGRWQPVWQRTATLPLAFRSVLGAIYKVPVLVLLQSLIIAMTPAGLTLGSLGVLIATAATVWLGIAISTAKEFTHRLYLTWFYPYRREASIRPTERRILAIADIGDGQGMSRVLVLLCLFLFVVVVGYGSIYYALEVSVPSSIDSGEPANSVWLACMYFSAVTMGTIGYGDVKPLSDYARMIVLSQVMLGPFLLTLLIFALSTDARIPGNGDRTGRPAE
jgi:hypothetical protein